jgi:hypothetical protein
MYDPKQILNAAELIQPVLPLLLDPATAGKTQAQLEASRLAKDVAKIWETLDQFPQTQRWRTKYLDKDATRVSSKLDGEMVAEPSGLIYACPHCNYRDVVFLLGMDPEPCPNHPTAILQRL